MHISRELTELQEEEPETAGTERDSSAQQGSAPPLFSYILLLARARALAVTLTRSRHTLKCKSTRFVNY